MNTSAPTIRAQELEIQRLKADVAELTTALTDLLSALDLEPDYSAGFAEYDKAWVSAEVHARRLIAKQGA